MMEQEGWRHDLVLIASRDRRGGIGCENALLARISEDMKRFRAFTTGNVIVVGRKTFESFPGGKPLPDRTNIVLSRKELHLESADKNVLYATSVERLMTLIADLPGTIYVCGGASIYQLLLPYCARALITEIDGEWPADAFLPAIEQDTEWQCATESAWEMSKNDLRYRFVDWVRIKK